MMDLVLEKIDFEYELFFMDMMKSTKENIFAKSREIELKKAIVIFMEDGNENVQLGKLLDENSYARDDKHINIDDAINIDFIREKKELHEVKKSKAIEEAGIWQLKYYLYYLKKRGVEGLTGKIDYPLAKRNIEIELTDEDCRELDKIIDDINKIKEYKLPPELNETKICKKCAYFDMCFI